MDIQKEYEKLYQQWLEEFQEIEVTMLNQELFNKYKNDVKILKDYQEEHMDNLKEQVLKSYKNNFNFLLNDFLKIREVKIINSALALKEINLDNVIEAEKLLYQNLISAIKGYKKVKAISTYEEEVEFKSTKLIKLKIENTKERKEVPISTNEQVPIISEVINDFEEENISYTLIRFLKKTPPLVGVDLINYGPFEKEDIANLPQENAKILIIEKFADKLDVP